MRSAAGLTVSDENRATLASWSRLAGVGTALARRAQIVLAAAEGRSNAEIATQLRVSRPTVRLWRARYATQGLAGLEDKPRSGRPASIDPLKIVIATLAGPPAELGIGRWSSRRLAAQLGISNASVAKVWAAWKLTPWRKESFRLSTDPPLTASAREIVGLYLYPPEKAIVLCPTEQSQTEATRRSGAMRSLPSGLSQRRTLNDLRHPTPTLVALLEFATGREHSPVVPYQRFNEFLSFLERTANAYPDRELHFVLAEFDSHTHRAVGTFLEKNPRVRLHFTETSAAWLTLVEVFCALSSGHASHPGSVASGKDTVAAIARFIDGWNKRRGRFAWIKPAA